MSTDLIEKPEAKPADTVLSKYYVTELEIAAMSEKYLALTIDGIDDKEGYQVNYDALQLVKKTRIAIENRRVELNADALAWRRKVNDVAKHLTAMIAPIEKHLARNRQKIDEERERIKNLKLQQRIDKLAAVDAALNITILQGMDDANFDLLLTQKTAEHKARLAEQERLKAEEDARLLAEEQARQQEAERRAAVLLERKAKLAEINIVVPGTYLSDMTDDEFSEYVTASVKAQEAAEIERKRMAEERVRLEAERLEAEKKAAVENARLADIERQQREEAERLEAERKKQQEEADRIAAEKKRIADEEAERQAAELKAREEAEELARQEALRPDREKLLAIADAVRLIEVPDVAEELSEKAMEIYRILAKCEYDIRKVVS